MTPTERAKEIVRGDWTANFCNDDDCITDAEWRKLESIIAAALTEARAEGFREARDKASELTVDHNGCVNDECFKRNCATVLFDKIEALAPGEK